MNNVSRMQKMNCAEHVIHQCFDVLLRKVVHGVGEDGAQILVEMLHHDEDVGELLDGRNHNIDQFWREQVRLHARKLAQYRNLA